MLDRLKKIRSRFEFLKKWRNSDPALCYHSVLPQVKQRNLHNVSPENLYKQLSKLKRKGFSFLNSDEFLRAKSDGYKRICSVTFDDGYASVLKYAIPVLESLGIPATLFISTCTLDKSIYWRDKIRVIINENRIQSFKTYIQQFDRTIYESVNWDDFYRSTKHKTVNSRSLDSLLTSYFIEQNLPLHSDSSYLSINELKQICSKDVLIGNHSHNHYRLSSLSKEEQADEISFAKEQLQNLNLHTTDIFCIPFGENTSFNQTTIDLLVDYNYRGFLMTNQNQFGLADPQLKINTSDLLYSNRVLLQNEPDLSLL